MTDQRDELGLPRLDGLASLRPAFEASDAGFGDWKGGGEVEPGIFTLPWFSPSELTSRLVDVAYRDDWVRPDFDWMAWEETPEAVRLRDDRGALEQATVLDLARLLTVVVRSERFGEGAIAEAIPLKACAVLTAPPHVIRTVSSHGCQHRMSRDS